MKLLKVIAMRFNTLNSIKSRLTDKVSSLDKIVSIMRSSRLLKELCESYQELLNSEDVKAAKELKISKVPAFAPCAFLYGGKSRNDVMGLTGYGVIDIDHITSEQVEHAFSLLHDDPFVVLAARSISNHGIHIIFRYEFSNIAMPIRAHIRPGRMNTIYGAVIKTVMAYYKKLLNLPMDRQCMNMERTMILSYDPELIYNPEAERFVGRYGADEKGKPKEFILDEPSS